MAKKQITINDGVITFTEHGDRYNLNEIGLHRIPDLGILRIGFIHGIKQKLSDCTAGKGPKAGYTPAERAEIRQELWERLKNDKWTVKRSRLTARDAAIKKAVANGMDIEKATELVNLLGL